MGRRGSFRLALTLATLGSGIFACSSSDGGAGAVGRQAADQEELSIVPERLKIGAFESRALLRRLPDLAQAQPLVVMLPGSGPQGPEEAIPGTATADGKDAFLFNEYAKALNRAGFATLQLGKPGVDYYEANAQKRFYDAELLQRLRWSDLVENAKEGIRWARRQPWVDSERILLLGHSEGTQVAVDIARLGEKLHGLILLGFQGRSVRGSLEYQLYEREMSWFVERDLDANHDGKITRDEAAKWKEFSWTWADGANEVAIEEIRGVVRANDAKKRLLEELLRSPLYASLDVNREYFDSTASLGIPVLVFTGELDLQTPAVDAQRLDQTCAIFKKTDCYIHVVTGVGHAFSVPRGTRAHPLFDITLGPPEARFLNELRDFSAALK